ncbi:hypothetical protein M514_08584, partial [Trichuris suis]
ASGCSISLCLILRAPFDFKEKRLDTLVKEFRSSLLLRNSSSEYGTPAGVVLVVVPSVDREKQSPAAHGILESSAAADGHNLSSARRLVFFQTDRNDWDKQKTRRPVGKDFISTVLPQRYDHLHIH